MTEDRLKNLEEMLAHQEIQLGDLSDMLILQAREISKLEREVKKLNAKIELYEADMQDGEEDGKGLSPTEFAAQNKPPHY